MEKQEQKLKTAEEALKEIYADHRPPGMAITEFIVSMEQAISELCQPEPKLSKEISAAVDEIIGDYFKSDKEGMIGIIKYLDEAKNPYYRKDQCLQSFLDGSYNKIDTDKGV